MNVFVTSAAGQVANYNGFTVGIRKGLQNIYQFEANYVLSKDKDDDSNERYPFTDNVHSTSEPESRLRTFVIEHPSQVQLLSPSRQLPGDSQGNFLMQGRTPNRSRRPLAPATNRNTERKDNPTFHLTGVCSDRSILGEHSR